MDGALHTALPSWVLAGWSQEVRSVAPTGAGMNSLTAVVELDTGRFVAKWVPTAQADALTSGSLTARRLAHEGLVTGEPLLTRRGDVTFPTPHGALALLRFVRGTPLTSGSPAEQRLMASTLAEVHAVEVSTRAEPFMADVLGLVHDVEPWVRPAVTSALTELATLPALTWGILHGDPATDAFRYDESTGRVGLIDWTAAAAGPVLYDVASAVMYLGGPARAGSFWTTYCDHSPAPVDELTDHIKAFHRFRGAVQAAYFSSRVATADLTGVTDQQENWKGLRDAQRMLAGHGMVLGSPGSAAQRSSLWSRAP